MTKDNVRDLIKQCTADGHVFLIAVAECIGDDKSMFTVWDNIDTVDIEDAEMEFMDNIAETFEKQGRWPDEYSK